MKLAHRSASIHFVFLLFVSFTLAISAQQQSGVAELNRKANAFVMANRFAEAKAVLNDAAQIDPKAANVRLNLGTVLYMSGDHRSAIEHLKKGVGLDPGFYGGYNQLGVVYGSLNKYEEAVEYFKKTIELKPDYALAYYNLGTAYSHLNKLKQSTEAFEKAKQLDPTNVKTRFNLGVVYALKGRYEESIKELRWVIGKASGDEEANLALLKVYLLSNDRESALAIYRDVKVVNPELGVRMFDSITTGRVIKIGVRK